MAPAEGSLHQQVDARPGACRFSCGGPSNWIALCGLSVVIPVLPSERVGHWYHAHSQRMRDPLRLSPLMLTHFADTFSQILRVEPEACAIAFQAYASQLAFLSPTVSGSSERDKDAIGPWDNAVTGKAWRNAGALHLLSRGAASAEPSSPLNDKTFAQRLLQVPAGLVLSARAVSAGRLPLAAS